MSITSRMTLDGYSSIPFTCTRAQVLRIHCKRGNTLATFSSLNMCIVTGQLTSGHNIKHPESSMNRTISSNDVSWRKKSYSKSGSLLCLLVTCIRKRFVKKKKQFVSFARICVACAIEPFFYRNSSKKQRYFQQMCCRCVEKKNNLKIPLIMMPLKYVCGKENRSKNLKKSFNLLTTYRFSWTSYFSIFYLILEKQIYVYALSFVECLKYIWHCKLKKTTRSVFRVEKPGKCVANRVIQKFICQRQEILDVR